MDIQNLFYIFGIIFMILAIGLFLFIAVIFFLIYRKVSELQGFVLKRIADITHPAEIAMSVGAGVAKTAFKRVKKIMDGNES